MADNVEEKRDPNHHLRVWTKISDETGINVAMVRSIYYSIIWERMSDVQITSKNATYFILLDLLNNDNGPIQEILETNGIGSSEDFGTVVRLLCEESILSQEEDDDFADFNNLFKTESILDYLKNEKLRKDADWYIWLSNGLFLIGLLFAFASYSELLPREMGLFGWGVSLLGWGLVTLKDKISIAGKSQYALRKTDKKRHDK